MRNDAAVRAWQHGSSKAMTSLAPSLDSIISSVVSDGVSLYVPVLSVSISRDEWSVWLRSLRLRVEYKNGFLLCSGRGLSDGVCIHVDGWGLFDC